MNIFQQMWELVFPYHGPARSRREGMKRLLKLADYLETVPQEQFDLTTFSSSAKRFQQECGTTACALGWAATKFNGQWGLTWTDDGFIVPIDKDWDVWSTFNTAARTAFAVTDEEAEMLFTSSDAMESFYATDFYATDCYAFEDIHPKYAAAKIREWAKEQLNVR